MMQDTEAENAPLLFTKRVSPEVIDKENGVVAAGTLTFTEVRKENSDRD